MITDYLQHIKNSKQEQPFYEAIIQIGDMNTCGVKTPNYEVAQQMLDDSMIILAFPRLFPKASKYLYIFVEKY